MIRALVLALLAGGLGLASCRSEPRIEITYLPDGEVLIQRGYQRWRMPAEQAELYFGDIMHPRAR